MLNNPSAISISIPDNFKDESDIYRFTENIANIDYMKKNVNTTKMSIFGIKKIIKNVNQNVLLGEIFLNIKRLI